MDHRPVTRTLLAALVVLANAMLPQAARAQAAGASPDRAHYQGLQEEVFLTEWLVLGPVPAAVGDSITPDVEAQRHLFETLHVDLASLDAVRAGSETTINGQGRSWQYVASSTSIVDLDAIYGGRDHAAAYALAHLEAPEPRAVLLGLGSDDGVRVWLNGELIHDNWVPRAVEEDNDVVSLPLKQGANTLLLKIQDIEGGWGFVARPLGPSARGRSLVAASARGDLDAVRALLEAGTNADAAGPSGLTALQVARIHGREGVVAVLVEAGADAGAPMPPSAELARSLLRNRVEGTAPGVAVLVARDGEVIFEDAVGYADLDRNIPISTSAKFRIGSITKQFTASAILRLAEQGAIAIEDPLSKFFPDFPRGDEVTIHHLLTHTSGIHSYTNRPQFLSHVSMGIEPLALVDSIKTYGHDFDPGTSQSYSNSGYFLLGLIVEQVASVPFEAFLRETFFEPLGMNDTGIHRPGLALENEAIGYSYMGGSFQRAIDWDMSWAGGAGAMYSTIQDLYRWNEALFSGQVLSHESLEQAFAPAKLKDGRVGHGIGRPYGLGWVIGEYRGERALAHGGGLHGFNSYLTRLPEKNVTVVALSNSLPPRDVLSESMTGDLISYFFWDELGTQPTLSTDATVESTQFDALVGRYAYPGGAILTVTREGDRLYAQLTGQPRFEIFPGGNDLYFWKVVDAQIQFVRNDAGQVTHGIHRQGGSEFEVARMEAEEEVTLGADQLEEYVGQYSYPGGAVLTVTREEGQLYAQLTGQPKFEIFARGDDVFFWKVVNAEIEFVRDAQGQIERGIHRQGGAEMEVPRIAGAE